METDDAFSFRPDPTLVAEVQKNAQKTKAGLSFVDAPFVVASAATLNGYAQLLEKFELSGAHVVQWPGPGQRPVQGGTGGSIVLNDFAVHWENNRCLVDSIISQGRPEIAAREGGHIFLTEAVKYPDSALVIKSVDSKPFILVMSRQENDNVLKPTDFVAFYFDGSKPLTMHADTWHFPVIPVQDNGTYITKQRKANGALDFSTREEFGVSIRVPNAFSVPKKVPKNLNEIPTSNNTLESTNNNRPMSEKIDQKSEILTWGSASANENASLFKIVNSSDIPKDEDLLTELWPATHRPIVRKTKAEITTRQFSVEWNRPYDEAGLEDAEDLVVIRDGRWRSAGCVQAASVYHVDKLVSRIDGDHFIVARKKAFFLMIIGPSNAQGEPLLNELKACVFEPQQAVLIPAKVWHSYPIPIKGSRQMSCVEKFNSVDAMMEFEINEECLKPLKIPMKDLKEGESDKDDISDD